MFCLRLLEARSSRSRCQQGHALSEGTREEWAPGLLPSFLQFADFVVKLLQSSHGILPLSHVSLGLNFPFYKDTNHNHLNLIICKDSYFQIKPLSLFWELGLEHLLWDHNSAHDSPGSHRSRCPDMRQSSGSQSKNHRQPGNRGI